MPTFGAVTANFTVPTDCVLQSSTVKTDAEIYSYKNALGVTIKTVASKMKTVEETIDMVGAAPLSTVVAVEVTATGVYKPISVKITEGNTEFPKSTVTVKGFLNS